MSKRRRNHICFPCFVSGLSWEEIRKQFPENNIKDPTFHILERILPGQGCYTTSFSWEHGIFSKWLQMGTKNDTQSLFREIITSLVKHTKKKLHGNLIIISSRLEAPLGDQVCKRANVSTLLNSGCWETDALRESPWFHWVQALS